ncbi:MAG: hypothetical protein QM817_09095 [Archangium sp.]
MSPPLPSIEGLELRDSIEPPHPRSTISDRVFLSSDPKIAVKVLELGFPLHGSSAQAWLALMQKSRSISSPHVAKVVAFGFTEHEMLPWFAMERVGGVTLLESKQHGDRHGAIPTREILDQLLAASTAARAAGVDAHFALNHAAFAPEGLRCWNFGVGQWRNAAREAVAGQYTAAGQLRWVTDLTPTQATGRKLTAADESVSLALISFALRTGRHYWNADEDPSAQTMQLLMEVMSGANEAPSQRAPSAGLSGAYDAWFKSCFTGAFPGAAEAVRAFPQS